MSARPERERWAGYALETFLERNAARKAGNAKEARELARLHRIATEALKEFPLTSGSGVLKPTTWDMIKLLGPHWASGFVH